MRDVFCAVVEGRPYYKETLNPSAATRKNDQLDETAADERESFVKTMGKWATGDWDRTLQRTVSRYKSHLDSLSFVAPRRCLGSNAGCTILHLRARRPEAGVKVGDVFILYSEAGWGEQEARGAC